MAKQKQPVHHLRIPVEGDDLAAEARKLGRHLLKIQSLAMCGVHPDIGLDKDELEAFKAVFALIIRLREIEDGVAPSGETPP